MENRKRPLTPTESSAGKRPRVVGTKASQARAKAITAQLDSTKPKVPQRKRPAVLAETDPLAKSYHTKASGLKERPSWDLRGKVEDMTQLHKFNKERLEKLNQYKLELEVLRDEKESAEKEALLKAQALQAEITTLERNHITNVADLHTNQRIESQQLEDNKLNFDRNLNNLEVEVSEANRRLQTAKGELEQRLSENQSLRDKIIKLQDSYEGAEAEIISLKSKIKHTKSSITEKEYEIEHKRTQIKSVNVNVDDLKSKLAEAHKDRDRLLSIVKDLEEDAFKNKQKVVTILNT
ncbi:hypothetical protein INT47_000848 [Mucor saturninus]|uniref:Uncharacterized protein n=1 Tax=Mucor saturninus TaxID=64648 RepID=A0A8H7RNI6_9FUNG|nr:hypothetical protein INT47_000848 [Mucor saturninus]